MFYLKYSLSLFRYSLCLTHNGESQFFGLKLFKKIFQLPFEAPKLNLRNLNLKIDEEYLIHRGKKIRGKT